MNQQTNKPFNGWAILFVVGLIAFAVWAVTGFPGIPAEEVIVEKPVEVERTVEVEKIVEVPVTPIPEPTPVPTEEPVVEEVAEMPVEESNEEIEENGVLVAFNPLNYTSMTQVDNPTELHLRMDVREPGDTASFLVVMADDFRAMSLLRVVPDDILTGAWMYIPQGNGQYMEYDIQDMLEMLPVTEETLEEMSDDFKGHLVTRGVNILVGEQLPQNGQAILFDFLPMNTAFVFEVADDASLRYKRGLSLIFNYDYDPFTVNFETGEIVENPTIILSDEDLAYTLANGKVPWAD